MTSPALKEFLPFAKPDISAETIAEITECLQSGWITTGPRVKKFESMIQEYHQVPHAITVASATAGLHICLLALDLRPGDEVITTSFTFVATLNTIVLAGGTPVLVDVDPTTYNMDLDLVEKAITPKTKAIVPVHFAGAPVDLDRLYALAKKYNLRIIEDAAHAIGAKYKNKKIGSFGDTQVFSFHPNKNITTIEGGCIVTQDADLAKKVSVLKFHGIDREAWNRFSKEGSQSYDVIAPGFKYNMTDVSATLGIHQLGKLDSFIEKRAEIAALYEKAFKGWDELIVRQSPSYDHYHAWNLFNVLINPQATQITRDEFVQLLKEENIGTGVHWQVPHLFAFYRDNYGYKAGDFPHSEFIADHVVSLPLFPTLTHDQQDIIIKTIGKIFGKK